MKSVRKFVNYNEIDQSIYDHVQQCIKNINAIDPAYAAFKMAGPVEGCKGVGLTGRGHLFYNQESVKNMPLDELESIIRVEAMRSIALRNQEIAP